ncbi:F0F1 ATP synthase subunit A [Patescibacteria group bacterium]|nr:F0F1 ATP synthase subunit A [Patescibacteria group bacterium]
MAASGPHISISAERIFSIGALHVTNSMITSLIVSGLLILFALWVRMSLKRTNRPTGVQNLAEWIVDGLTSLVHSVTNNKAKTEVFFPVVATFFLTIIANNWFGLLPGVGTIMVSGEGAESEEIVLAPSQVSISNPVKVAYASEIAQTEEQTEEAPAVEQAQAVEEAVEHVATAEIETEGAEHAELVPLLRAGTADLNMTIALGLISVGLTQYYGLKYLSLGYLKKYINFSSPINFAVGLLEIILEFAKVVSFAFRLFGNIFAGEVLLAVISFLVAVIAPMPFYGLELFVGFIQALVFSMLSVVLFNMATISHDEH